MKKVGIALLFAVGATTALAQERIAPSRARLARLPYEERVLIAEHLQQIVDYGWAEVVPGDLYHAHFMLPPDTHEIESYESLSDLLSHAVVILYHSDEQLMRWRITDGDLPTEERRPRSIIGYPDGSVVPASEVLPNLRMAKHYEWYGTIHPDDLARQLPEQFDWHEDKKVLIGGIWCMINLQVTFHNPDTERPDTIDPDQLRAVMDCNPPPERPTP